MKSFAAIALIVISFAAPASALTFSLPDLSFPDSATTVSTQSCSVTADSSVTACK